jgi:hypothetical protein
MAMISHSAFGTWNLQFWQVRSHETCRERRSLPVVQQTVMSQQPNSLSESQFVCHYLQVLWTDSMEPRENASCTVKGEIYLCIITENGDVPFCGTKESSGYQILKKFFIPDHCYFRTQCSTSYIVYSHWKSLKRDKTECSHKGTKSKHIGSCRLRCEGRANLGPPLPYRVQAPESSSEM